MSYNWISHRYTLEIKYTTMSYNNWQYEMFGNVLAEDGHNVIDLPESDYEIIEVENGLKQQEQLTEWFEQQAELQLIEKESE